MTETSTPEQTQARQTRLAEPSASTSTKPAHDRDGWLSAEEYAKLSRTDRAKLAEERKRAAYVKSATVGLADDYRAALAAIGSQQARHVYVSRHVVPVAMRGRNVLGINRARFVADVVAASGVPPLTEAEVGGIWDWCERRGEIEPLDGETVALAARPQPLSPPPKPRKPTEEERGFVRRMIEEGRELLKGYPGGKASELLAEASPVPIPDDVTRHAAVQLRTLAAGQSGVWFAGEPTEARDAAKVQPSARLIEGWEGGAPVPSLVSVNPHTGEGIETTDRDGQPCKSYRHGETVAEWRRALVEFDDLPLDEQAAFWLGVLSSGSLDVVTLTYTGGKSLHGIVRLDGDGTRATFRKLWGKIETRRDDGTRDDDATTWGPLSRLLASDPQAVEKTDGEGRRKTVYPYCVDFAARNVLTTRLAGHLRTDYKTPHAPTYARLLWAKATTATAKAPTDSPSGKTYARACADCPLEVKSVCTHIFGASWLDKSDGGRGCNFPLDSVAEDWAKAGWKHP